MKIIKTKFKGLYIVKKNIFYDLRGYFYENFKKNFFRENFVLDNISLSKKNTIRGLHFQIKNQQAKYVSVIRGKVFDVCLDLRRKSKTFGKFFSIILSEKNKQSLFIPRGFAHGFCAMENNSIIYYKNSKYYDKNSHCGILWNDPDLKIKWPIKKPILSKNDVNNYSYAEFLKKYKSL